MYFKIHKNTEDTTSRERRGRGIAHISSPLTEHTPFVGYIRTLNVMVYFQMQYTGSSKFGIAEIDEQHIF